MNNISDIKQYMTGHPWLGITDLNTVVNNLVGLVFVAAVVIFFFLLILGGIQWMTAGGKQEALQEAKGRLTSALIGLVILFSAWAIFNLVKNFFGLTGTGGTITPQCLCVRQRQGPLPFVCNDNCPKKGQDCLFPSDCL